MLCAENRREQRHSFETRDNPLSYFLFSSGGGAVNTFICKKKKGNRKRMEVGRKEEWGWKAEHRVQWEVWLWSHWAVCYAWAGLISPKTFPHFAFFWMNFRDEWNQLKSATAMPHITILICRKISQNSSALSPVALTESLKWWLCVHDSGKEKTEAKKRALSKKMWRLAALHVAGGLELYDSWDPFQPSGWGPLPTLPNLWFCDYNSN